MKTIVASYNITPNQPTSNDPLWLSDSDQIGVLGHVSLMYIYKTKHNMKDFSERMRNSLSKLLFHYYPVAGRMRLSMESGRMELDCNAKGVTFLEAETTNTFSDYGDFSPSELTDEFIPKLDDAQPVEEIPLLLVQLTRFHGGEGLAVGVLLSHPLTDATGIVDFMNAWAKLARGEEQLNPNEIPFLDRTLLKFPPIVPSKELPDNQCNPNPTLPQTPKNGIDNQNKRSGALLKLTSTQIERLKKNATMAMANHQLQGSRPYTRFEVVAAHIWRCASKALGNPTQVRFSVNFRNRMNPPLPHNYFGNAVANVGTPTEGDIISKPLGFAAHKIREAANEVTDEFVRSQINVSRLGQGQLNNLRAFFMRKQGHRVNIPQAMNHSILFLTSFTTMPVYEADFGWGKPMHFGLASRYQADRAAILPSPDGDGVVVTLFFQTALMHLFKKYFYEDICVSSM